MIAMEEPPQAVTVNEAARQLGVHRDTVLARIADGSLEAFMTGPASDDPRGNKYRVEQASIDEFKRRNRVKPDVEG